MAAGIAVLGVRVGGRGAGRRGPCGRPDWGPQGTRGVQRPRGGSGEPSSRRGSREKGAGRRPAPLPVLQLRARAGRRGPASHLRTRAGAGGRRCSWGAASAAADPGKGPGVRGDARQLRGARVSHSPRDRPRDPGGGADLPPSPLREVSFAFPAGRGQHLRGGRTGPLGAPAPGPQRFPAGARGATLWRRHPPRRPGAAAASPGNQRRVACYVRKLINSDQPGQPVSVGVTVGWVTPLPGVCGDLLTW